MHLTARLAYYSVADPTLLRKTSAHSTIEDYADITQYLTPRGVRYLQSYVVDQVHDVRHAAIAAELALSNLPLPAGVSKEAERTRGTSFSTPFSPRNYRSTINPSVGLGPDGVTLVASGSCSVQIPGSRNGKPYLVTLARTSFTYYLQPKPSKAYPVGVEGWVSNSTATYTRS